MDRAAVPSILTSRTKGVTVWMCPRARGRVRRADGPGNPPWPADISSYTSDNFAQSIRAGPLTIGHDLIAGGSHGYSLWATFTEMRSQLLIVGVGENAIKEHLGERPAETLFPHADPPLFPRHGWDRWELLPKQTDHMDSEN